MNSTVKEKNPAKKKKYYHKKKSNPEASMPTETVSNPTPQKKKKSKSAKEAPAEAQKAQKAQKAPKAAKSKTQGKNQSKGGKKNGQDGTVKIISLGGLGEIGKNITVFESRDDIVIIDCGLAFPDDDMFGIDLVIPDFSYLEKNRSKIRGVLITHGHEDHVGGIPYLLKAMNVPVFGSRLAIEIIKRRLSEFKLQFTPKLNPIEAGDTVKLGKMQAEFIHVNHSIADSCAILLRTPAGNIFHSGDFKLDVSPIDGKMMDIARIGEIGNEGVTLMLCESTNAERPGFTPSEKKVMNSLEHVFMQNTGKRVIIATFSSNIHRVQQIIDVSVKYNRKVAVFGRSMESIVAAATELGYMNFPEGTLIGANDIKRYNPEQLTLITTGSQGEPMSALYRMAFSEHDRVRLTSSDVVVLSSSAIPGNEKLVGKIVNALIKNGIKVVNDSTEDFIHVSGHACQEELKLMHSLVKPKFFMPIHGESRHLYAHKEIAEFLGMNPANIFISEIGKVLEIDKHGAKFNGSVKSGMVLVDGSGTDGVKDIVLSDRQHLAQDGLVLIVASIDLESRSVISGPDVISRGFVHMKESEELIESIRHAASEAIEKALNRGICDWVLIKTEARNAVARLLSKKTKCKPMILPVIMNI